MADYRAFTLGAPGGAVSARFQPLSYDRALGAFRILVNCQVALRGGSYRYESNEVWIRGAELDRFGRELELMLAGKVQSIQLMDLGGSFTVGMVASSGSFLFTLRNVAPVFKGSQMAWESSTPVTREELELFQVELGQFKTPYWAGVPVAPPAFMPMQAQTDALGGADSITPPSP